MVDPNDFGKSKPKVEQSDLEGDVGILTIAHYEENDFDDDSQEGGTRKGAYLTFEEMGDKVIWLNKTQIVALVERLGSNEAKWPGQRIPVEKVTARFGNKSYDKVVVVGDPSQWDEYLGIKPTKTKKVGAAKGKKVAKK